MNAPLMGALVGWLESAALSSAMRDTTWVWPLCETVHFIGLAMVIGGAGVFDLRLLGGLRGVPVPAMRAFIAVALTGFALNLVTGAAFFIMAPAMYVYSTIWWVKVLFIAIAGTNAFLFETTLATKALSLDPDAPTSLTMKVVGAVSLTSWFVVLYCGRMLPYLGTGN